jgi:hypothetical protein
MGVFGREERLGSASVVAMTVWDELKPVIARLLDQQPGALASYPLPDFDLAGPPPFKVRLEPWAADVAEQLHRQFGDDVELTVGLLPYPPGRPAHPRQQSAPGDLPALLDPDEVTVTLDEIALVSSGHTLHHHLTVHSLIGSELLLTSGRVTAVVDPQTGETVGGFSGAQTLSLKFFRVSPGGSTSIPLLIGTASSRPQLGYAIPPGEWGIQATLTLGGLYPGESPRRRTPILPLTVIS